MTIPIRVDKLDAMRLRTEFHNNSAFSIKLFLADYDDTKRRNKELQERINEIDDIKEYMIHQDEMITQILSILTRIYGIKVV